LFFTERNGKNKVSRRRLDLTGLLMNLLGPSILLIAGSSFALVFLDMDAIHVFIPPGYVNQPGVILLRIILQAMGEFDWVVTAGQMHLVLITLLLHTKSIFGELAVLDKRRQVSQKDTTKRNNGSKKREGRHVIYSKLGNLQLYSLANYFFTVVNQDMSFTVVFILLPGFAIDVAANYMILKMYEEFPIYLYVFACLMAIVVPTLIALELPKAGENYDAACELLHGWKEKCPSRRSLRYKRVVSFRPIGYTMGGFFTFKKETVTTFAEALMDYTINSILSF
jgi:hypothetical protein